MPVYFAYYAGIMLDAFGYLLCFYYAGIIGLGLVLHTYLMQSSIFSSLQGQILSLVLLSCDNIMYAIWLHLAIPIIYSPKSIQIFISNLLASYMIVSQMIVISIAT